jgi:aspartyl/asparaginyl beta-hydroxylase (cupin superfamily)
MSEERKKSHEELLKEGKKYNSLSNIPENPKTFYVFIFFLIIRITLNSNFVKLWKVFFVFYYLDNFDVILKELNELDIEKDFIDWPESVCDKGSFRLFGFVAFGREIKDNCERCPKTVNLIKQIPNCTSAAFSCQGPNTHLAPHYGYYGYSDLVLRCHLGLICNDNAQIQVGDDLR